MLWLCLRRYTEKARRVIFFSRYEASQFGSPYIESEHMLLGFLRENKSFASQVIPHLEAESIRQEIGKATLIRACKVLPDLGQTDMRTGAVGGGGGGRMHPETRVAMRRSIVFHSEADDTDLGETFFDRRTASGR